MTEKTYLVLIIHICSSNIVPFRIIPLYRIILIILKREKRDGGKWGGATQLVVMVVIEAEGTSSKQLFLKKEISLEEINFTVFLIPTVI